MNVKRMTVLLLAGLVMASLAGPAAAQDGGDERLVNDLDALAATYNENLDAVPDVFVGQLANERVSVRVDTDNGAQWYYADTGDDARVQDLDRGQGDDPTVRVTTDAETLDAIQSSDDPAATALDAYDSGDIRISGVGMVDTVKVEVVKAAISVGRFLGLV